jgi:hypothetical protein
VAGLDPVPDHSPNDIARCAATALNLRSLHINIETSEEAGDALIRETAFAQDPDLVGEQLDYLSAGKSLLMSACSLAKLASCYCDLVNAVRPLACHPISPEVNVRYE